MISGEWHKKAQQLQKEAHVFYFAFKHPRVHWYAKWLAVGTAGYLFSPVQLIPNFIPVIGFLDDVLVVYLGTMLLRRLISSVVLEECRELAETAEMRRKDEIKSTSARVAFVVVATVWILAGVGATVLMARCIPH